MHLETLLYMLLQSDKTVPPTPNIPDFQELARQAHRAAVPNQWIKIPAQTLTIGMDDPENEKGLDRYFGWDNEKPKRRINVHAFEAKARPLTNEDFTRFLQANDSFEIPASWISSPVSSDSDEQAYNGCYTNSASSSLTEAFLTGKFVRTVYGPVPLEQALHWPVMASYNELARCAKWMNGRIPTAEEVRSIYNVVEAAKKDETDSILTKKISAVNG